ncbi:hypothetical protein IW261DRAFT_1447806 [Armillaria novae-zelandiae]|uniref:Uncharacterized protein n=1 Tax=Armillaria novae-zelandiae TaxID=153914 RepID=A0AA39PNG3_9AGAR|nr:hypothetical protein IW261DRAFT_1447806 [Armillaria novae-zelandiae]
MPKRIYGHLDTRPLNSSPVMVFKYKSELEYSLDEPNFMLCQMIYYTGEDIRAERLSVSLLATQFFDITRNSRANPPLFDSPFEIPIRS